MSMRYVNVSRCFGVYFNSTIPVLIASDASHTVERRDMLREVYSMDPGTVRTNGAIIAATGDNIANNTRYSMGIHIDFTGMLQMSSYGAELITGAATMQILGCLEYTSVKHVMDCKGAIHKLTHRLKSKDRTNAYCDILQSVHRLRHRNQLSYTPGHPSKKEATTENHFIMEATDIL